MAAPAPSGFAQLETWNLVADGYVAENVPNFVRYARDALELARLAEVADARVVDVATGPGTLALLAAEKAAHVDAIDFAPGMIEKLHARLAESGRSNVAPRVGDGEALPYPDGGHDLGFSMFGLMFFPDRARGFAELRRVLRPGGRAVVSSWQPVDTAPAVAALFRALAPELPQMAPPAGIGPLTDPDAFRAEMRAAGFRDVDVVARVHVTEWSSGEALWRSFSRGCPPLVGLAARLGDAGFAPVAERVRARFLEAVGEGPVHAPMPAWLGVGAA